MLTRKPTNSFWQDLKFNAASLVNNLMLTSQSKTPEPDYGNSLEEESEAFAGNSIFEHEPKYLVDATQVLPPQSTILSQFSERLSDVVSNAGTDSVNIQTNNILFSKKSDCNINHLISEYNVYESKSDYSLAVLRGSNNAAASLESSQAPKIKPS